MKVKKFIEFLKSNRYSENTIKTYESILNIYQESAKSITLIKDKLISYSGKPNTAWTHYNVLCSYMRWAKDGRIALLKELKLPRIPKVYMNVFDKDYLEQKVAVNKSDATSLVQKKLLIKFLFETGIRASELKSIIKVKAKTITLVGKGNKIREIFHNIETTRQLKEFTYSTKTLRIWVKEILGKNYTPHSIRRSHATHLLLNGANPKMVMLQLGHEKIETTFRYLNLSMEENWKIYSEFY